MEVRVDESEPPLPVIWCEGRNDAAALRRRYRQVEEIAKSARATLLGVQFLEDEEADGEAGT